MSLHRPSAIALRNQMIVSSSSFKDCICASTQSGGAGARSANKLCLTMASLIFRQRPSATPFLLRDHRLISTARIQLGKAQYPSSDIGMSLSRDDGHLRRGRPTINGGEFIEITLQFWAREAFDVTNQVAVLCLKSLEGPSPDQWIIWPPAFIHSPNSGSQASSCENPTFHSIAAPENASARSPIANFAR